MKVLKENSGDFEIKLKATFEDLNGRIKLFEDKIQNFQKRKEEVFWSVKTDFERKFREGESYFMTQLNVFKNMLNTKIESKDFKNIMEDLMETKVLELRSDLFMNKNALAAQIEEIKGIKEASQISLDAINSEIKEDLNNLTNKLNQMEGMMGSDRNDMAVFQEKIIEIQENIDGFKQNLNSLQKETEQRMAKENEMKAKDLNEIREVASKFKEKEKKTEGFINELKKENNFSKVNQLEMNLIRMFKKTKDESKILMESLKNKVNILSVENVRLKERENFLLKEVEEMNKKQKIMFSLEQNRLFYNESIFYFIYYKIHLFYKLKDHENKSDTATNTHTNTNTNYNYEYNKTQKNPDYFVNKPILPKSINERKPLVSEKNEQKENIYRKEKIEKQEKSLKFTKFKPILFFK